MAVDMKPAGPEIMRRGRILVVAVLGLVALAAAVSPWTVSFDPVTRAVSRQLRSTYGLELAVGGRSVVAVLPVPRLKLEDVQLSTRDGVTLVRAGQLRGEFSVLPLLLGRLQLSELALNDAEVEIDIAEDGRTSWDASAARLQDRAAGRSSVIGHLQRIGLNDARLTVRDRRTKREAVLDKVDAVLDWPAVDGALELTGAGSWGGETVTVTVTNLRPALLAAGTPSRFELQATMATARLALAGEVSLEPEPRLAGRGTFTSPSLRDFLQWSGFKVPLGSAVAAVAVEGEFSAQRRTVYLPAVKLTLGSDRLDGAVTARLDGDRLNVAGTLAADRLNLTDALGPFAQARTLQGGWSAEPIELGAVAGGELDLRLSASSARIGAVRAENIAANVIVKPGRIEVSVGRATLHRGSVKGRLALAPAQPGADVRLHGSFDRVDLGGLLADLGQPRWLSGAAQGQVALESVGVSPLDLAGHVQGRVTATIRQGELIGVALGESLRRLERRPLSAPLDWRGGRTPFEQFQINLNVGGGVGEVADGQISATALRAVLQGRVSVPDRTVALKTTVDASPGAAGAPSLSFDIVGPWNDVVIVPDARALIQRSGAARSLLKALPHADGGAEPAAGSVVQ